jgi:hypothetical protein
MLLIVPVVFIVVLVLERGKIKTKSAIIEMLIGATFGFSFNITYFYHRSKLNFPFDPRSFLIVPFVLFIWVLTPEWYQIIKKRESLSNILLITIAILIYLIIPFLSLTLSNWLFLVSLPF